MNPIKDFLFEPDPKVGGAVMPLIGKPGSGKSIALTQIGLNALEQNHTVLWRGTQQAQWMNFLANNEKVVIWNHSSIKSFESFITTKKISGNPEHVDLEEHDVEIKEWEDPEELVNNLQDHVVNVVNIPGVNEEGNVNFKNSIFFFRKMWIDICRQLINRTGGMITFLFDEIGDFAPCQQQVRGENFPLIAEELPNILAQMRKKYIWFYGAGHGTHDMHYNIWKIKNNGIIYMARSNVKRNITPQVDQGKVNGLGRGEFILDGDKGRFALPYEPKHLDWMPSNDMQNLELKWKSEVPNLIDNKSVKEIRNEYIKKFYENTGLNQSDIAEVLDISQSRVSRIVA